MYIYIYIYVYAICVECIEICMCTLNQAFHFTLCKFAPPKKTSKVAIIGVANRRHQEDGHVELVLAERPEKHRRIKSTFGSYLP